MDKPRYGTGKYGAGKSRHSLGYVIFSDGRLEHRIIMEQHLGRPLKTEEIVHHKDGNPSNNRLDNLELLSSQSEHMEEHYQTARRWSNKAFECFKCKQKKPLNEFTRRNNRKLGIQGVCKTCIKERKLARL